MNTDNSTQSAPLAPLPFGLLHPPLTPSLPSASSANYLCLNKTPKELPATTKSTLHPSVTSISPVGYRHIVRYKSKKIFDCGGVRCPTDEYRVDRLAHPEKKTSLISVRVPSSIKEHMQAIADVHDRPLSWVMCKVLQHYKDHGLLEDIIK